MFVQVTFSVPLWLITVANDEVLPTGTVLAVIVQFAVIVNDTTRLAVPVVEFAATGINNNVVDAAASSKLDLINTNFFFTFNSDSKDSLNVDIEEE